MSEQNVRGFYTDFTHDRQADWDFYEAWQPNVMHLMVHGSHSDPNSVSVDLVRRVHDTSPQTTILLRCWDVDDRRDPDKPGQDAHAAMQRDPIAEADKQVEWWARVIDRCTAAGVPRNLLMAGMNNETPPEMDSALYPYTERALVRATGYGFRLGVLVFSVGRPALPGEAPFDMTYFSRLETLIRANNGATLLNEYMQKEGMYGVWTDESGKVRKDWPYLMGRHLSWPMNVPIIMGEWGLDGILYNRNRDPRWGHNGWLGFPQLWPPTRIADEYVAYCQAMSANVIGVCGFKSDSNDHRWDSFDFLPAYAALLERKHLCVRVAPSAPSLPGTVVVMPWIGNGSPATGGPAGPTATSITEAGARIRAYPGVTSAILGAVPNGTSLKVTAKNPAGTWYRVDSPFGVGWVSGTVVAVSNVKDVPVVEAIVEDAPAIPLAAGILDPQVLEAILQVESGGRAFGADGRPLIRFEAHVFRDKAADKARVDQFFSFDQVQPWTNQVRLQGFRWLPIHTGKQADEYDAFAQAQTLDIEAAHKAISMGAGQVMGFNHQRIGYASALTMFAAFGRSVNAQLIGMVNYMLSDPALVAAVKARNWEGVAAGYNGGGNIAEAAGKYRAAYDAL